MQSSDGPVVGRIHRLALGDLSEGILSLPRLDVEELEVFHGGYGYDDRPIVRILRRP